MRLNPKFVQQVVLAILNWTKSKERTRPWYSPTKPLIRIKVEEFE